VNEPIGAAAGALGLVLAVLVVLVAVYSVRRRRRERLRLERWARANSWTLTWNPAVDWGRMMPGGNPRGVTHGFSARVHGRPVTVAEYSTTGAESDTTFFVIVATTLGRPLPPIEVSPRGLLSRGWRKLAGPGEVVTGNPDFDGAFRIRSEAPAEALRWLPPPVIAAQLRRQVPEWWSVRGTELLTHHPGRLRPDEVPREAQPLIALADLFEGNPR
jgi:hypothetical protein